MFFDEPFLPAYAVGLVFVIAAGLIGTPRLTHRGLNRRDAAHTSQSYRKDAKFAKNVIASRLCAFAFATGSNPLGSPLQEK